MISVVIPTYKEPDALDLCLKSAIEGQYNKNQIIVVVDGFYDLNKEVLEKYKNNIDVLNIEENVGMIRAMNYFITTRSVAYKRAIYFPSRLHNPRRAFNFNIFIML